MSDRIYTLDEQIRCLMRELSFRSNFYPKWVRAGRMTPEAAAFEIACMQSIHDRLSSAREMERKP